MLNKTNKEQLYPQLQKLLQLDSLGLFNNQFIIGYVAAQLPTPINKYEWRTLFDKLENMKKMVISQIITVQHVMQVILVSLAKTTELYTASSTHTTGLELRKFMITLDENMNQVVIDSNSLQKKYFQENKQKELKEEKFYENKYLIKDELKSIREDFSQKRKNLVKKQPLLPQSTKIKDEKKQPETTQNLIQTSERIRLDVRKALESPLLSKRKYAKEQKIQKLNEELNIGKSLRLAETQVQKPKTTILNSEHKKKSIYDPLHEKGVQNPQKNRYTTLRTSLIRKANQLIIKNEPQKKKEEKLSFLDISFDKKKEEKVYKRENSPEIVKRSITLLSKGHEEKKKQPSPSLKPFLDEEILLPKRNLNSSNVSIEIVEKKESSEPKVEIELKKPSSYRVENEFNPYSVPKVVEEENIQVEDADLGIQCPICCQKITFLNACPVACSHILHKTCLNEYFKNKVLIKSFPILCPEDGCLSQITIADVQEYIDPQIKNKYFEFSLHVFVDKNSSTTSWCPTPGCSAVFQVENNLTKYECMSCQKNYCIKCRCEFHKGMNCEQYREIMNLSEEDKKFVEFVNGCQFKQCPNCRFWVSKIEGCDHMTCRCSYEFCYRCGGPYNSCNCEDDDYYDY